MPAQMIPESPTPGCHRSERELFTVLHEQLPTTCHVFHSVPVAARKSGSHKSSDRTDREVDFLVVDSKRGGALGIELKSGRLQRDENGYYNQTKGGRVNIESPARQSQIALYRLRDEILKTHLFKNSSLLPEQFGWCVALSSPAVRPTIHLGPDLPRNRVLDAEDLKPKNITKSIARAFTHCIGRQPPIKKDMLERFTAFIAPTLNLVPNLNARIQRDQQMFHRLATEQKKVFNKLEAIPRLHVQGPAGSGKTLLAMERAHRLTDSGQTVAFLCVNKNLAEFLRRGLKEVLPERRFPIMTIAELTRDLIKLTDQQFPPPISHYDYTYWQKYWDEEAPNLVGNALSQLPDYRVDALVVDEGQDFGELWWLCLPQILEKPTDGSLWVFGDQAQNLHDKEPPVIEGIAPYPLTKNFRNTKKIAAYSYQQIEQPLEQDDDKTPRGVKVTEKTAKNRLEMIKKVKESLHQLVIKDAICPDRIIVLTPRSSESSAVRDKKTFGKITLTAYKPKTEAQKPHKKTTDRIYVPTESIHRFKGLERDVVVLCEVRPDDPYCTDHHLYMATSRARHDLHVIRYLTKAGSLRPPDASTPKDLLCHSTTLDTIRRFETIATDAWHTSSEIAGLPSGARAALTEEFRIRATSLFCYGAFASEPHSFFLGRIRGFSDAKTTVIGLSSLAKEGKRLTPRIKEAATEVERLISTRKMTKTKTARTRWTASATRTLVRTAYDTMFNVETMAAADDYFLALQNAFEQVVRKPLEVAFNHERETALKDYCRTHRANYDDLSQTKPTELPRDFSYTPNAEVLMQNIEIPEFLTLVDPTAPNTMLDEIHKESLEDPESPTELLKRLRPSDRDGDIPF